MVHMKIFIYQQCKQYDNNFYGGRIKFPYLVNKQIYDKIKNGKIKNVYLDCHSTIFIINNQQIIV